MKLHRRTFLQRFICAAALPTAAQTAWAQAYPERSVRVVVPVAAGGANDVTARLIGQWLSEHLGRPFVIENRPGAATNIGTEVVIRASPDGYTLLIAGSNAAINATLFQSLSFNFIRDTAPIGSIVRVPQLMQVTPSLPVKTVPEFIAYAKAHPGKIAMGSGGNGSPAHVVGEYFKLMTGTDLIHVPYRGAAPAVVDLISGQIQVAFTELATSLGHVKSGRLRALAVTTAARAEVLPDVPALIRNARHRYRERSVELQLGHIEHLIPKSGSAQGSETNSNCCSPSVPARGIWMVLVHTKWGWSQSSSVGDKPCALVAGEFKRNENRTEAARQRPK